MSEQLTCNRPLTLTYSCNQPQDLCGKPAVWRIKIGLSGQLTTILWCEECAANRPRKFTDAMERIA